MHRPLSFLVSFAAAAGLLLAAASSSATERHFTYTYESGVLEAGAVELEPWTTFRLGRESYYNRVDNRLEFELGLTDRLQTSLYWNFTALAADETDPATGVTARVREFEWEGVSSEWKYKLTDPVADALGSALYLEGTLAPAEAELELKIILDKQFGRWLLAGNLVGEYEWEFTTPGDTEHVMEFEVPVGLSYFVTPSFTAGLEVRPVGEAVEGELETIAIYAGPTISTSYDRWWLALSVLPQVFSPKNEDDESLDLEDNEYVQSRLILGFHL